MGKNVIASPNLQPGSLSLCSERLVVTELCSAVGACPLPVVGRQVETLQEGVIKLVRRTELKDRIARCHALLLSLTRLNQAICNGTPQPPFGARHTTGLGCMLYCTVLAVPS